jgi:hypothetical protein
MLHAPCSHPDILHLKSSSLSVDQLRQPSPHLLHPRPLQNSVPMAAEKAAVAVIPSNGDPDGSRFKEYEAMYQYSITRPEEFWAKEAMVNKRAPRLLCPSPASHRAIRHTGAPVHSPCRYLLTCAAWSSLFLPTPTHPTPFSPKHKIQERLSWVRPFDAIKGGSLKEGNQSWFMNGQINACYNCCDRHDPDKVAITWEGNEVRSSARGIHRSSYRFFSDACLLAQTPHCTFARVFVCILST